MVVNGRAILFLIVAAIVVEGLAIGLYKLLLPTFKKWFRKADKKYKDYEKKEDKK